MADQKMRQVLRDAVDQDVAENGRRGCFRDMKIRRRDYLVKGVFRELERRKREGQVELTFTGEIYEYE